MSSTATIALGRPGPAEVVVSVSGVVDEAAVDEIASRLAEAVDGDARIVVVEFDAVRRCDCRVLPILDQVRGDLLSRGGVLHVRGLTAQCLTGFAQADLPVLLDTYRASLGVAAATGPWEPGSTGAPAVRSTAERRLVRACAELASGSSGRGDDQRGTVLDVADRLVEQCLRWVGATAAVVILRDATGRAWPASSSSEPARLLETSAAFTAQGPAMACLLRGEPVSLPDLDRSGVRWAGYAPLARRHGFAAARGLPIRPPGRGRTGVGARTIGALSLLSDRAGPMAADDLGVAQDFAELAAIALAAVAGPPARGDRRIGRAIPRPAAMVAQVVVEQAKGVLAAVGDLTVDQAEERLRHHASTHGISVTEAAAEVIDGRLVHLDAPAE